jgi:hypothetical protein
MNRLLVKRQTSKHLTKMKILFIFFSIIAGTTYGQNTSLVKDDVKVSLDLWHKAAGDADFEAYFELMTDDAVFVGTDATENWNVQQFKLYAKPHFDAGRAWSFTTIERNIYVSNNSAKLAWFDELLSTQMGVCRGSGIVQKVDGKWKVKHYVLSIAVPNENVAALTALKKQWDTNYIKSISNKF